MAKSCGFRPDSYYKNEQKVANYFFEKFPTNPLNSFLAFIGESKHPSGIRFLNQGRNLCYVNASVNGLLSLSKVRETVMLSPNKSSAITDLLSSYALNRFEQKDASVLRREIGGVFSLGRQEDSAEFIQALLLKAPCLKALFEFETNMSFKCLECNNTDANCVKDNNTIFTVGLGKNDIQGNLEKALTSSKEDAITRLCSSCNIHQPHSYKYTISKRPDALLIQLMRFDEYGQRKADLVQPNITLTFGGESYSLKSVVEHSQLGQDCGHIVAYVHGCNNWIKCDDSFISASECPKMGYIFFYEKNTSPSVTASPRKSRNSTQQKRKSGDQMSSICSHSKLTRPSIGHTDMVRVTIDQTNVVEGTMDQTSMVMETTDETNEVGRTTELTNVVMENTGQTNVVRETTDQTNVVRGTTNQTNIVSETTDQTNVVRETTDQSNVVTGTTDQTHVAMGDSNQYRKLENLRAVHIETLLKNQWYPDLFEGNPILESGSKMHDSLSSWQISEKCSVCNEAWFDQINKRSGLCERCSSLSYKGEKEIPRFSSKNDMTPGDQPECIKRLNQVEVSAISQIICHLRLYKRMKGTHGFSGHCISFAQDVENLANCLPRAVRELPIIILERPHEKNPIQFQANGSHILEAILWLKENNDEYKHIQINHEALREYPNNGGDLQGILRVIVDEDDEGVQQSTTPGMTNDETCDLKATLEASDRDLPRPDATVCAPLDKGLVDDYIKKAVDSISIGNTKTNKTLNEVTVELLQGSEPVSEFMPGFFSKAFPHLFPDGKADFTKPRLGKQPTFLDWAKHLLRLDRRFAKDPLFPLVVVNMYQRRQTLTLGNLYALRSMTNMTVKELKAKIEAKDFGILKSMFCFSSSIKGSQQFFSQHISKAYSFLRDIKISSNDKEMFNLFLTFSAADFHWHELHLLFPDHEKYLGKTVVKKLSDIPSGADPTLYIDEKTDFQLRQKAVHENVDIVNEFFQKRITFLWEHILKPEFKGKDYIMRYEFQNRGSIHCHMVMSVENGPSSLTMEAAQTSLPKLPETDNDELRRGVEQKRTHVLEARTKMIEFTSLTAGISSIHPTLDPKDWLTPVGQNPTRPSNACLRKKFQDLALSPYKLVDQYKQLVNKVMLHNCRLGYCLKKNKYKLVEDKSLPLTKDGKYRKRKELVCRFDFPCPYHGYMPSYNENGMLDAVNRKTENDIDNERNDTENDLDETEEKEKETDVSVCQGCSYVEDRLRLSRNHPNIVAHICELLLVWMANTDQKTITSYDQLLMYLLKYVMKPESQSDMFSDIARTVLSKVSDDTPLRKVVTKILNRNVGQRDMSVNECLLIIQGLPYVCYSKTPRYASLFGGTKVQTSVSSENVTIGNDDNWQEAYWKRDKNPNFIAMCKNYPTDFNWDKNPKDISLREFMKHFTKKWKVSKNAKVFPVFTPTFRHIVHKGQKRYEEYCKWILLQDKPGCYFDNAGKGFASCEAELKDFVDKSPHCPEHIKDEFYKSQVVKKDNEVIQMRGSDDDPLDELLAEVNQAPENDSPDDWMRVYDPGNETALNEIANRQINAAFPDFDENMAQNDNTELWNDTEILGMSDKDLRDIKGWLDHQKHTFQLEENDSTSCNPENLNTKQKMVYDIVTSWVLKKLQDNATDPLYLNISGRAGCGKSYLLNCLSQFIKSATTKRFLTRTAPTGTAAFMINGVTLHSLLKLPVNNNNSKDIPDLHGEALQELQQKFTDIELIAIDEKSMMGLFRLYTIHKRLCEAKGVTLPFGGVAIILMGDFAQLPPVLDTPMYSPPEKVRKTFVLTTALSLFKLFEKTVVLDQIMRQQGDDQKDFRDLLSKLSEGKFGKKDWEKLKERDLNGPNFSPEQKQEFLLSATMICAYNEDLHEHNKRRILALNAPLAHVKAEHNCPEASNSKLSSNEDGGLPKQLVVCKGMEIMIVGVNLWSEAGLTNGAKGTVKYLLYKNGEKPPSMPVAILAFFPKYLGPSYIKEAEKVVPIIPVTKTWHENKKTCSRTMFPLVPGYATSIHKAQGATLSRVIVNLGPVEYSTGLAYTAISRCKTFENLAFLPFPNGARFFGIARRDGFKIRLLQDKKEAETDKKLQDDYEFEKMIIAADE